MIRYLGSVTNIGPVWLDTRKKVCVNNVFKDVTSDAYDPCNSIYFALFAVTSIQIIQRITKIRNKMEGNTKDSTVQDSKDREIDLISRKVWRKIKSKVFKRRSWLINNVKRNINTVAEELLSSEDTAG